MVVAMLAPLPDMCMCSFRWEEKDVDSWRVFSGLLQLPNDPEVRAVYDCALCGGYLYTDGVDKPEFD